MWLEDHIPFFVMMVFAVLCVFLVADITGISLTNHRFSDLFINNGFWMGFGIFICVGLSK